MKIQILLVVGCNDKEKNILEKIDWKNVTQHRVEGSGSSHSWRMKRIANQ